MEKKEPKFHFGSFLIMIFNLVFLGNCYIGSGSQGGIFFLEKSERIASYIDMNLLTGASMVMWKCLLLLNSLLYIWLQDNNIVFWRKFVNEYFAPRAKKR